MPCSSPSFLCVAFASLAIVTSAFAVETAIPIKADPHAALKTYVDAPDDSYAWTVRRSGSMNGTDYAELALTSQTWRETPWRHQLFVIYPSTIAPDCKHAFLFIGGGSWRDSLAHAPGEGEGLPGEAPLFARLAEEMQTPVAVLMQVPFQPMYEGKKEDELIAYTFEQFLRTREGDWPLLLPMTKAAVKAMDATTEHAAKRDLKIETFTVSGASKRGWTTWLTGAVDERATHIAPMVIDVLNMQEQMKLHLDSWGKYSQMIQPYTNRGLQKALESELGHSLRQVVDPFAYLDDLTEPKLVVLGTNDPYWPVNAANLYFDALQGPKYLLYIPNAGHGLIDGDASRVFGGVLAFHRAARGDAELPQWNWKHADADEKATIDLTWEDKPLAVRVWRAESTDRDFRDEKWKAVDVQNFGDAGTKVELARPTAGYAAAFAEVEYPGVSIFPARFSTTMKVLGSDPEFSTP